jgi:SulP family sulfate permease
MALTSAPARSGPAPLTSLPAAALRAALREGYGKDKLRSDVLAGLVVGVVALPLSMALAINTGVAPQYGLYTAIVAGLVVALLGGSRTQVTGPTAAFIPILVPIVAKYGFAGLVVSGLMGGVILVAMGLMRMGRLIEFIPYPVTTGFTAGIAVVIATLQIKDFLGLQGVGRPEHYWDLAADLWRARGSASGWEFATGLATFVLLVLVPRISRKIPAPLLVLPVMAVLAWLLARLLPDFHVATIGTRFQGGIPQVPPLPVLPWSLPGKDGAPFVLGFDMLKDLLPGAFAISMLGAIESLLSAVVADGMIRTKHDPDAELLALGVGNLVCPFFGGIPATGAIARTATNIRYGGRSPVASVTHALTVLAAVLALAPLISYLPMASLAALLVLVAKNMAELKHVGHILKVAPQSDRVVLLTCITLTVAFDMVISVSIGVVLAAILFMRRMADLTGARLVTAESLNVPRKMPEGVVVYDIAGPLFFGAAQRAMGAIGIADQNVRVVIIRLEGVPTMDATGLVALESAIESLQKAGRLAVLVGCRTQPRRLIREAGLKAKYPQLRMRGSVEKALETAEEFLKTAPEKKSGNTSRRDLPAAAPK